MEEKKQSEIDAKTEFDGKEEKKFDDEGKAEVTQIQIDPNIKSKKISQFINLKKSWDDAKYNIPADIMKGIRDGLNWDRPSKIQSVAIPYIIEIDEETKEHTPLIAQAKNGAGKSGAFIVGSLLRIDPSIQKPQVVVAAHSRELVQQLADVCSRILAHAPSYKMCNLANDKPNNSAHIFFTTLGTLKNNLDGRSKSIDLSQLRVFVLDEADVFFKEKSNHHDLEKIHNIFQALKQNIQYIFFSATYEEDVSQEIAKIIKEAYQISLNVDEIKLDKV